MFFVIKIAKDYIRNSTGKHYRYSITSLTKKNIFTDIHDGLTALGWAGQGVTDGQYTNAWNIKKTRVRRMRLWIWVGSI
jgi:hypothetical protein